MTLGEQAACAAQIGNAPASQIRHTRTGAQRSVLVLASSIVVAFLAAANAPSPLYARYETAWHASPLIGTIAFAAYAVAVIVGLLWLSELPALLGRRAVLLGAIAGQVLALVLFAVAGSFALIVGRAGAARSGVRRGSWDAVGGDGGVRPGARHGRRRVKAIVLTNSSTHETTVWKPNSDTPMISTRRVINEARSMPLRWTETRCCDSDGHSYTVTLREVVEPRLACKDGHPYYMVTVVPTDELALGRDVEYTLLMDAMTGERLDTFRHVEGGREEDARL